MNTLETLESNVTRWAAELQKRTAAIAALNNEMARLVGESIDGTDPAKAKTARSKRADCLAELSLQEAELSEVKRRYEMALQEIGGNNLQAAKDSCAAAEREALAKWDALQAAIAKAHKYFCDFGTRGYKNGEQKAMAAQLEKEKAQAESDYVKADRKRNAARQTLREIEVMEAVK